jgi:TRAP-type C4-dicarboxylate transport system permease small subunit
MLILHFVVPFIMLLFRCAKRTVGILVSIAAVILLAHLARYFWLVVPSLHAQHFLFHWTYFTIPIGMGGIWLATVLWQFQKRTLISGRKERFSISSPEKEIKSVRVKEEEIHGR